MILAGICMIAPQQLRAEVPQEQMDGVMGQSIKEEMDDTQISDVDTQRDGLLSTYAMPRLLGASKASSGYTQDFLDGSFTSKVDYTSVTYYHKSDYEDAQLLNGIDVSWWQAKNKKTTALNWEKIHDAGIDFAFVRVASRDTSDGSIYEDTAADSHIQAALENDINVGLYIFSQALTEKEAKQEAEYVLDLADKYGWDVTLPIVIDREKGSHNRLTGGKLSKAKETAVCQSFADTISDAGYQPVVYASYAWIKSYIDTDSLEDCGIWIARYNNTTTSNAKRGEPYADTAYDYEFWQYSSVAKVSGYTGNLDVNFWYKDTSAKTGGLKATVGNAFDPVKLSWGKAADDVTGYRVYRYDEKQKKYVYMKQTSGKSFTDTDVTSGKTYQYRVLAYRVIKGKNIYSSKSKARKITLKTATVKGDYQYGSVYGPYLDAQHLAQVRSVVQSFKINYIRKGMSDYDRVLTAYNYLRSNCSYAYKGWQYNYANTAWGALVYGEAQCSGYARAMKALCDAIGVDCRYVHADSKASNPSHQWNQVRVGGKWYILDAQSGGFLLGSRTWKKKAGMSWDTKGLPTCSVTDYKK